MSVTAFIRQCLASGMAFDDALKAAEAFEAQALPEREALTARQARNRRYYEAKRLKASENKTHKTVSDDIKTIKTVSDAPSCTRVVTPFSSSLRSEEVVVVGVEREREPERESVPDDWPAGKAQQHALLIVEAVASPWLDPTKSPDLVTTAGRLVAWRKAGASWEHDVLAVVGGLCANRRSRVASWKFFDQAIAKSIADNRAALEIPAAGSVRATGPPDLAARIAAEHAEARRRVLQS